MYYTIHRATQSYVNELSHSKGDNRESVIHVCDM
jgi:hypothetical protein